MTHFKGFYFQFVLFAPGNRAIPFYLSFCLLSCCLFSERFGYLHFWRRHTPPCTGFTNRISLPLFSWIKVRTLTPKRK